MAPIVDSTRLGWLLAGAFAVFGANQALARSPGSSPESSPGRGEGESSASRSGTGMGQPAPRRLLVVDSDDDDDNGVEDRGDATMPAASLNRLPWLPSGTFDALPVPNPPTFRLVDARGVPARAGTFAADQRVALQGIAPGSALLHTSQGVLEISVVELRAVDFQGRVVDLARSHASLSRQLPAELEPERPERDALRWLAIGLPRDLPHSLQVLSFGADGETKDALGPLVLTPVECPSGTDPQLACRISAAVRASTDPIDRRHPAAAARSILAEVGGRLRVELEPGLGVSIRVGGPRGAAGHDVGRYRAVVRAHLVNLAPGSPAVGSDERQAREIVLQELATANALWGQCGIHFGPLDSMEIHVVDAPSPHLFAVGCGEGQPASGGTIRVLVGGRLVELASRPAELPAMFASRLARRIEALGFRARVSLNAVAHRAAKPTADVLVRDAEGRFVSLGTPHHSPASSDPSLPVCLGEVDLSDGLQHFTDFDAGAGTVEERALVKAFEDDDPRTIELIVVPSFGGSGRIGESFIFGPGASLQNAVIVDRAGIRAGARSFTLAHELGHILLDMPGHPDDFGIDTPMSLMDADAADATIFGPRRLSIEDCERALRQSGPSSPTPLLEPWPLFRDSAAEP